MYGDLEKTLAALLRQANVVTAEEWDQVLEIHRETNRSISLILEEKGIVAAQILAIITKIHMEADRLIEDAKITADEMIQTACRRAEIEATERSAEILSEVTEAAMTIVAESLSEVMQADSQPWSDLERYVDELADIRDQMRSATEPQSAQEPELPETPVSLPEAIVEPDPLSVNHTIVLPVVASEDLASLTIVPAPPKDILGMAGIAPDDIVRKAQELAGMAPVEEPAYVPEGVLEEYFDGKVELDLDPPVDVVRLLDVTRHLRNTPGIKILQSCGTWNEGMLLTISLDQPMPLLDILKTISSLESAEVILNTEEEADDGDVKAVLPSPASGTPLLRIAVTMAGKKECGGKGTKKSSRGRK